MAESGQDVMCNRTAHEIFDFKNRDGETALHVAAKLLSNSAITTLLAHGASVDVCDSQGRTALHLVCAVRAFHNRDAEVAARARLSCMQTLLDRGASPNATDATGSTPLHSCSEIDDNASIKALLAAGAHCVANTAGDTPLHVAAIRGHVQCLQTLVLWDRQQNGPQLTFAAPSQSNFDFANEVSSGEANVHVLADLQVNEEAENESSQFLAGQDYWIRYVTEHGDPYWYQPSSGNSRWYPPEATDAIVIDSSSDDAQQWNGDQSLSMLEVSSSDDDVSNHDETCGNDGDCETKGLSWDMDGVKHRVGGREIKISPVIVKPFEDDAATHAPAQCNVEGTEIKSVDLRQNKEGLGNGGTELEAVSQPAPKMKTSPLLDGNKTPDTSHKGKRNLNMGSPAPDDDKIQLDNGADQRSNERHLAIWEKFLANAVRTAHNRDVLFPASSDWTSSTGGNPAARLVAAAAQSNVSEVVQLLHQGHSPNLSDNQGRTPLHHAASSDALEVVKSLFDYGADVDVRDACGNTPLHVAVARGAKDIAEFLLSCAASADEPNDDGDTPLHLGAWMGNYDCVKCLLLRGANVHMSNSHGLNALDNVQRRSQIFIKNRNRKLSGRKPKPLPSDMQETIKLLETACGHIHSA